MTGVSIILITISILLIAYLLAKTIFLDRMVDEMRIKAIDEINFLHKLLSEKDKLIHELKKKCND